MEEGLKVNSAAHRWTVTVLCLYASGATGLIYLFSVYSDALKKEFGLSQSEVESINTVMFVAGAFSTGPGALVDYLGPNRGVRLGGVVMATCFIIQYFVCTRKFDVGNDNVLVVMCGLAAVQFMSSASITAAVFPTLSAMYKPEESRGLVIGEGKGWVGLFGAIVVQIYTGVMGDADDSKKTFDFLLFLAASSLILTQITGAYLTKTPKITNPPLAYRNRLKIMIIVILATCVVTTVGALLDSKEAAIRLVFLSLLALLLTFPIISAFSCFDGKQRQQALANGTINGASLLKQPLSPAHNNSHHSHDMINQGGPEFAIANQANSGGGGGGSTMLTTLKVVDKTTKEMVQDIKCWLLLWCTFNTIGGGILITVNTGQMVDAVGAGDGAASVAVTLFAVSQALGRLSGGLAADEVKTRLGLPSSSVLVAATSLMTMGHLINASSTHLGTLLMGVAVCGLGFGAVWPLMVVLSGDLYGVKSHGANYNFYDGLSSCCGSLLFGLLIPSTIYNMHKNSDGDCLEPQCFTLTYTITALCSGSAVIVSLILVKLSDKPTPFSAISTNDLDSDQDNSRNNSSQSSINDTVSPLFNGQTYANLPLRNQSHGVGSGSLPDQGLESCELMEEERGSTIDPGSAHGMMFDHQKVKGSMGAVV